MSLNALLSQIGLSGLKYAVAGLVLPPTVLLLWLAWCLWRAGVARRRGRPVRLAGLWVGVVLSWALSTQFVGHRLMQRLAPSPPPLTAAQRAALRGAADTAIVVLGAGARADAPEVQAVNLKPLSIERLRHGIWLARQTQLPLLFTGGSGYGAPGAGQAQPNEGEAARRIAVEEFGWPLRWVEDRSRDTHENARFSLPLLQAGGIHRIVLVTHGFHMARAVGDFERAAAAAGWPLAVLPAPMGLRSADTWPSLSELLPSWEGVQNSYFALHEWLGRLAGA